LYKRYAAEARTARRTARTGRICPRTSRTSCRTCCPRSASSRPAARTRWRHSHPCLRLRAVHSLLASRVVRRDVWETEEQGAFLYQVELFATEVQVAEARFFYGFQVSPLYTSLGVLHTKHTGGVGLTRPRPRQLSTSITLHMRRPDRCEDYRHLVRAKRLPVVSRDANSILNFFR
jgi:hypothetical protein